MSLNKAETAHRTAGLVYCLWLLGILFGITAIVGVYINYSKLDSVRGTHAYSHFIWQMASFWVVFVSGLIALIIWPGTVAKFAAIVGFSVWIFSGMIGSFYLSKSEKLSFFFTKKSHTVRRHPHHLRHKIYDQPESNAQ